MERGARSSWGVEKGAAKRNGGKREKSCLRHWTGATKELAKSHDREWTVNEGL